jgi:tetratricopeptide (TPR) repeat protein
MIRLRLEPSRAALDQLERAIDSARGGGANEHLVRMLVWRAQIALADDIEAARALFAEAVAAAGSLGDEELEGYTLWVSAQVPETIGALDEQARILRDAGERMRRSGAVHWLVDVVADMSANALRRDDRAGATRLAEEARSLADERGTRIQRFKALLAVGRAQLAVGEAEHAHATAANAYAMALELGGPWALAESSELLAEARIARGDAAGAREVLERAAGSLDPAATPAMRGRIARIHALLSRALLLGGQREAAEAAARTAASVAPAVDVRARSAADAALAAATVARAASDVSAR